MLDWGSLLLSIVEPSARGTLLGGPRDSPVSVRFPRAGAYRLEAAIQGPTDPNGLPYTLRVLPAATRSDSLGDALRPTGARARLTIDGMTSGFVALIPDAVAQTVGPGDYGNWAFWPGDYSILLVRDTLYRICRLPCARVDSVVLKPGMIARRRF